MTTTLSAADVGLMRVACAALDGSADWLARRVGTYDEQEGEAGAAQRAADVSQTLKLRLAAYVLDCGTSEPDEVLKRR